MTGAASGDLLGPRFAPGDIRAGFADRARLQGTLEFETALAHAGAVQMALGAKIGRLVAHDLIGAACKRAVAEDKHLRDVLASDSKVTEHLRGADLDQLFDPVDCLGAAEEFATRALSAWRRS